MRDVPLNEASVDAILDLRAERYFVEDASLIADEHEGYTRTVLPHPDGGCADAAGGGSILCFAANLVNSIKQPDGTLGSLSPRQVAVLLRQSASEITELYYVKKDASA